ncbi:MAG: MFS transporter [Dehalococcoidia bacterium]|nr:MFS transporter [Dehalococcoidia bacterium]
MANLLVMVSLTPLSAVLPSIAADLDVGLTTASWIFTSFLLTLTALLLTSGRLGDLLGHKKVFLWGAVTYTVSATMCGFAQDISQLIILRAIQGVGGALISGNSLAILVHNFAPEERGKAVGVAGMAASVGGLLGVLISSVLAEYLSWRWLFYLLLPLGLVSIKSALGLKVHFKPTQKPKIDVMGSVLLALTLVVFTLSLSHLHEGEPTFTQGAPYHIAMLGVAILLAVAFLLVEQRHPQPILELRHLRQPLFITSVGANGIMHMTMLASTFLLPFLIQRGLGLSPIYTAGILIPIQLANMVAAPFSGWLFDKTGWRFMPPVGMAILSGGLVLFGLVSGGLAYWGFVLIAFVLGLGLGLFMTPNNTIIMGALPTSYRGFSAGMLETSRQLGHSLGVSASSAVLGLVLISTLPVMGERAAYLLGFQQATLAAGAVAFVGFLLAVVSSRIKTTRQELELTPGSRRS